LEPIDALINELKTADEDRVEAIKQELLAAVRADSAVRDHVERQARSQVLVVQWELEEVLEAAVPQVETPPEPEPEPDAAQPEPEEPEEDPTKKQLTAADLDMVYDDPRGLVLHRTKDGKRWFATQVDPRTMQPQTFELHASEIDQLKKQLTGSPYWLLGAGA